MKLTSTLTLPPEIFKFHWAALGITGSGKSYTIKWFVEQLLDAQQRVCIVDPKGDWWGLKSSADGKSAGYPLVIFGGEHADVPIDETSGAVVGELVATGNRPCIIDLKLFSEAAKCKFMIGFLGEIFRRNKARLMLVLDEAHEFAPQNPMKEEITLLHWTNKLLSQGRSLGVQVVLSSQRPAKVHKDSLTQTQVLFALRVISVQDRKAVEAWVAGVGDTKQAKIVTDSLARLPVGEGWLYAPGSEILERVKFPRIKTYDSSATPEHAEFKMPRGWASVNLDELSAKMVQVKAEVDANDPKVLRKEIADLKRKLADQQATPVRIDAGELGKAQEKIATLRQNYETESLNLVQFCGHVSGLATRFEDWLKELADLAHKHHHDAGVRAERISKQTPQPLAPGSRTSVDSYRGPTLPAVNGSTTTVRAGHRGHTTPGTAKESPAPAGGNRAAGDGSLNSSQQRILDALAWLKSIGIEEPALAQVCMLARIKAKSGHFNNTIGPLSSGGMIVRSDGRIRLLPPGESLATVSTRPLTLREYHSNLRDTLAKAKKSGPTVRMFDAIVAARGDALTLEQIVEATGIASGSGHFNNSIGPLGTLGLIRRERGNVIPTEILFPHELR